MINNIIIFINLLLKKGKNVIFFSKFQNYIFKLINNKVLCFKIHINKILIFIKINIFLI